MKRKFLLLLVTVALVLCSTNAIFAQEVDDTSMSVEESYLIGKNYLKLPESGSSYYTVKLNSDYRGYKTVKTFEIPTGVKSVVVRTKNLGIYRNSTSSWLACQYQIGGTWVIESDRPF